MNQFISLFQLGFRQSKKIKKGLTIYNCAFRIFWVFGVFLFFWVFGVFYFLVFCCVFTRNNHTVEFVSVEGFLILFHVPLGLPPYSQ